MQSSTNGPISIAVHGATGRLGTHICELVDSHPEVELHAALGRDTPLHEMSGARVLVDVSHRSVSERAIRAALDEGMDVVVGTSGWDAESIDAMREAVGGERAVIFVPNFSLGSVLGSHLAAEAARWFDAVEILEAHHERKVDAPSGTAVRTAEQIAAARDAAGSAPYQPATPDEPGRGHVVCGIPVHAVRLPGVVAEQSVTFGGRGETLEVRHRTISQNSYDDGVLLAIREATRRSGVIVGLGELLGLGEKGAK